MLSWVANNSCICIYRELTLSLVFKVAKKLKKEKVNVDVISFGEDAANADLLQKFIDAVNGKVERVPRFSQIW